MSNFTKCAAPTTTGSCDPTKHVNYNNGMVIGVDDFNQEFSYLSGRDKWMARDLIGYGTVSGLRISHDIDVKGPRVVVSPGVAVSPCGQMIRVPGAQCVYLNDWLKLDSTKQELAKRPSSPPSPLRTYVVLCYRDCPTDNVPIPGEPCRSEDDLMAPSRLADDFTLELRFDPPSQTEEDAVRDFVQWLEQIEISDTAGSTPMEDFLEAIREAGQGLISPPDFMFGSPPGSLVINAHDACRYLRAAYRIWAIELRPKWRPDLLSNWQGCCGHSEGADVPQEECVLLAEVDVPIVSPGGGVAWQVDALAQITLNEETRPYVTHLRMLQESILCGGIRGAAGATGLAASPSDSFIIAAGRFDSNGNASPAPLFSFSRSGTLTAKRLSTSPPLYFLEFTDFSPTGRFVVKGTPVGTINLPPCAFEVIPPTDPGLAALVNAPNLNNGIILRITSVQLSPPAGFMVEISKFL